MPDKSNTKTSKRGNVKTYRMSDLPLKQRKLVKNYMETGKKRDSAIKAGYSEVSAHVTANRILKSDKVLSILNDSVEEAEGTIRELMLTSDSEAIRLAAGKEVLDRTIGKPVQRSETLNVNITVESMLDTL